MSGIAELNRIEHQTLGEQVYRELRDILISGRLSPGERTTLRAVSAALWIAAMSVTMGGNVRVGMEDSVWAGPGKPAESSAQQVRTARQVIEGLGLHLATPDDAREILQLKGADKVAF